MRLALKNIGKLSEADIELNGITVIAGENDTGKSTVGKVLYTVFNGFYDLETKIANVRINQFAKEISSEFEDQRDDYDIAVWDIARDIFYLEEREIESKVFEIVYSNLHYHTNYIVFDVEDVEVNENEDETLSVAQDISQYVLQNYSRYYKDVTNENIFSSIFNRRIKTMFHSQLNNFFVSDESTISLQIKNKVFDFTIEKNQLKSISDLLTLKTEILYLDNPFILDEWWAYNTPFNRTNRYARFSSSSFIYRQHLINKLLFNNEKNEVEGVFKEAVINEKINNILNKINYVCKGELSFSNSEGVAYTIDGKTSIDTNNVSAGLKTFIIIKTLLMNGSIEKNGTLILDEPEIHLHPEWQLLFAEIIVLLQKEFNLHILLTTHSPYFLEAIEVYAKKYDVVDRCRFYKAEKDGNNAIIKNVTNNIEQIYQQLAEPFQNLEDMEYSDE